MRGGLFCGLRLSRPVDELRNSHCEQQVAPTPEMLVRDSDRDTLHLQSFPDDLEAVIAVWPKLSPAFRAAVLALVKSTQ